METDFSLIRDRQGLSKAETFVPLSVSALGPVYNEFGYKELPAKPANFLCIKIIDSDNEKFSYNEQPLFTKLLMHRFARYKLDPVYLVTPSN